MATLRCRQSGQWPEKSRIGKEQGRWKVAIADQPAGSIDVIQKQIEQLNKANADRYKAETKAWEFVSFLFGLV